MSLFHRKKEEKKQSLSTITWDKFKKRRLGLLSLFFLFFLILVSIAGYLITPDHTPFCNEQILEIRLLKPGSKIKFLKVAKNQDIENHSVLHRMLFGQENPYILVPITDYKFSEDSVEVKVYNKIDSYQQKKYHLADVSFALQEKVKTESFGDSICFTDIYNNKHTFLSADLKNIITTNNLKTKIFVLGTDRYGRDLLSQMVIGARVSLSIGFISICIALFIGVFLGAVSGYFGGFLDDIISWFINVIWSVPSLLLVIAISFVLGAGFWQVFIAIGLTMWVDIARVVRGQFISYKEKEYVEASKSLGFKSFTIIFKHILPNINGTLLVISASNFASAILTEAGLSFLGIGVQSPLPSWGNMIKENYGYLILDYAYLAIIPGIAIVCLVLAFMLLGNTLRDIMDIKE